MSSQASSLFGSFLYKCFAQPVQLVPSLFVSNITLDLVELLLTTEQVEDNLVNLFTFSLELDEKKSLMVEYLSCHLYISSSHQESIANLPGILSCNKVVFPPTIPEGTLSFSFVDELFQPIASSGADSPSTPISSFSSLSFPYTPNSNNHRVFLPVLKRLEQYADPALVKASFSHIRSQFEQPWPSMDDYLKANAWNEPGRKGSPPKRANMRQEHIHDSLQPSQNTVDSTAPTTPSETRSSRPRQPLKTSPKKITKSSKVHHQQSIPGSSSAHQRPSRLNNQPHPKSKPKQISEQPISIQQIQTTPQQQNEKSAEAQPEPEKSPKSKDATSVHRWKLDRRQELLRHPSLHNDTVAVPKRPNPFTKPDPPSHDIPPHPLPITSPLSTPPRSVTRASPQNVVLPPPCPPPTLSSLLDTPSPPKLRLPPFPEEGDGEKKTRVTEPPSLLSKKEVEKRKEEEMETEGWTKVEGRKGAVLSLPFNSPPNKPKSQTTLTDSQAHNEGSITILEELHEDAQTREREDEEQSNDTDTNQQNKKVTQEQEISEQERDDHSEEGQEDDTQHDLFHKPEEEGLSSGDPDSRQDTDSLMSTIALSTHTERLPTIRRSAVPPLSMTWGSDSVDSELNRERSSSVGLERKRKRRPDPKKTKWAQTLSPITDRTRQPGDEMFPTPHSSLAQMEMGDESEDLEWLDEQEERGESDVFENDQLAQTLPTNLCDSSHTYPTLLNQTTPMSMLMGDQHLRKAQSTSNLPSKKKTDLEREEQERRVQEELERANAEWRRREEASEWYNSFTSSDERSLESTMLMEVSRAPSMLSESQLRQLGIGRDGEWIVTDEERRKMGSGGRYELFKGDRKSRSELESNYETGESDTTVAMTFSDRTESHEHSPDKEEREERRTGKMDEEGEGTEREEEEGVGTEREEEEGEGTEREEEEGVGTEREEEEGEGTEREEEEGVGTEREEEEGEGTEREEEEGVGTEREEEEGEGTEREEEEGVGTEREEEEGEGREREEEEGVGTEREEEEGEGTEREDEEKEDKREDEEELPKLEQYDIDPPQTDEDESQAENALSHHKEEEKQNDDQHQIRHLDEDEGGSSDESSTSEEDEGDSLIRNDAERGEKREEEERIGTEREEEEGEGTEREEEEGVGSKGEGDTVTDSNSHDSIHSASGLSESALDQNELRYEVEDANFPVPANREDEQGMEDHLSDRDERMKMETSEQSIQDEPVESCAEREHEHRRTEEPKQREQKRVEFVSTADHVDLSTHNLSHTLQHHPHTPPHTPSSPATFQEHITPSSHRFSTPLTFTPRTRPSPYTSRISSLTIPRCLRTPELLFPLSTGRRSGRSFTTERRD
ncbi:hypothetical protein BLNAU_6853 [Blattamonas nauphoetae]|uniref:Uncharacterized protein n=1 Tax=Blattamonas nauphoetae TaxID=2049346 RepID=A0ABQ9Y3A5_9EUKA|nr:hypothetical protein BLNAU_6853 [Blattamonas nauphoetae]